MIKMKQFLPMVHRPVPLQLQTNFFYETRTANKNYANGSVLGLYWHWLRPIVRVSFDTRATESANCEEKEKRKSSGTDFVEPVEAELVARVSQFDACASLRALVAGGRVHRAVRVGYRQTVHCQQPASLPKKVIKFRSVTETKRNFQGLWKTLRGDHNLGTSGLASC